MRDDLLENVIAGAKAGDADAVGLIYDCFLEEVRAHVNRIVRNAHDREDVTQTVFAKLMTAICRYEPAGVPFSAWLGTVARNTALDHVRRPRLVLVDRLPVTDDEPQQELGFERAQSLKLALGMLPAEQREVVVLRHIVGLTPGEIARRLDKTEGSVHSLHHRGRGTLRAALLEAEAGPVTSAA